MSIRNSFPISENVTFIPAGFHCHDIDPRSSPFYGLRRMGCVSLIAIESPTGWEIRRGGKTEPAHIDLFFLHSGTVEVETAERSCRAAGGQSLVIPSWIDRIVQVKEAGHHIYARFDVPGKYPAVRDVSVRNTPNAEAVAFYTKMLLLNNPTYPDESAYRANLAECLAILFQRELHPSPVKSSPGKADALLRQLQCADAAGLAVHRAAREFGMSLSAFRKFCIGNFGKSPGELICEVRMSRARALLRCSEFSIDDIAVQLGYADRFAFSKAFARINGLPPAVFRKKGF